MVYAHHFIRRVLINFIAFIIIYWYSNYYIARHMYTVSILFPFDNINGRNEKLIIRKNNFCNDLVVV